MCLLKQKPFEMRRDLDDYSEFREDKLPMSVAGAGLSYTLLCVLVIIRDNDLRKG